MAEAAVKRTCGRGRFITFEGGEGSGKSTQIQKLAARLDEAKLRVLVTREPGGSPGAEIIRHLVLSGMGKLPGPCTSRNRRCPPRSGNWNGNWGRSCSGGVRAAPR